MTPQSKTGRVLFFCASIAAIIVAHVYYTPRANAETADKDILAISNTFKSELQEVIDQNHSRDVASQEAAYEPIVQKYINIHTSLQEAVAILRSSGFSISVSGEGFFEAYPASGLPSRGTMVSGILYYRGGFLSGGALGIHMRLYPGNYTAVKDVKIAVNTISP
jgi:hypothetical protein